MKLEAINEIMDERNENQTMYFHLISAQYRISISHFQKPFSIRTITSTFCIHVMLKIWLNMTNN